MSQINVSHLTFTHAGSFDAIFEDVSFTLDTNWRLGVIGRNGQGKTTFLQLLAGTLPHHGAIQKSVPCLYFPFPVSDPTLLCTDLLEELAPQAQPWQLSRELSLLDIDDCVIYQPFNTLSNGEQTKLLLACLFLHEDSYLMIDEPTNHLDTTGRKAVSRYLSQKKNFLLVSHDRQFLNDCTDHLLVFGRQKITVMQGSFEDWEAQKKLQDESEQAQNKKLLKESARLSEAAKRTEQWSQKGEKEKHVRNSGLRPDTGFLGHKAAKMMKRAKVTQARQESAALERKSLLRDIDTADALIITPLPWEKPSALVTSEDLHLFYGDRLICQTSFTIAAGERVAITGSNGCGKSTLLKAICGQDIKRTGTLTLGSGLVISHVAQDTSFLQGSPFTFAEASQIDEPLFFTLLRKFGFARVQFEKDMSTFSAGQKKKVLLARSLAQQAHLYLWDEPLNYIDLLSRVQIETLLLRCNPTMLFVEHDETFSAKIATKQINL